LRLPVTFRALRSPGYRLFFSGQLVSLMGTWIQIAALNWLVYHIGGSTRDIGLVSLGAAIPLLPFSLLGGALVDRVSRKKFIFTTQLILMVQAFGLYFLVAAGDPRVWQIMALSVVLGAGTAMDHPARQAFVVDVLERREDLINAVALNATLFNLARTVGPAIEGRLPLLTRSRRRA
jgi:MFS family permease